MTSPKLNFTVTPSLSLVPIAMSKPHPYTDFPCRTTPVTSHSLSLSVQVRNLAFYSISTVFRPSSQVSSDPISPFILDFTSKEE
jgi:hypothetical protein